MFSFLRGKCLEVESLGHRRGVCEPYKKLLGLSPTWLYHFYSPISKEYKYEIPDMTTCFPIPKSRA